MQAASALDSLSAQWTISQRRIPGGKMTKKANLQVKIPTHQARIPLADSTARAGGVRSLERGLALLVAMNRRKLASVADLAKDTRLPRPTVYRLLDTLAEAGFVSRESATDRYRPTHGVLSLSDGFLDDEWITEAAPMMAEFTREHVWPISLFTFEAGKMLVRDTTHRLSSLSIDYGMVGKRMGMLHTAGGLAYLAFCPDNERKVILDLLAKSDEPGDQQAREDQMLDGLFKSIRAKGYATQERVVNPKAASISVPIMVGRRVYGCMSLIFIASALTMSDVENKLLPPLQAMTAKLARALKADRSVSPVCAVS
ncbi:MAG: helix-turn-helix domain-containing protein [Pseudolabrys sp.]|nr:helix-turn-helix domain-containing protein [Pseudolabrys sp.]